jgi:hypothetical protein
MADFTFNSSSILDQLPMKTPPQQIVNHFDSETAYRITQYPFRPGINTYFQAWVETRQNYGQRIVQQIFDPYTAKWAAPKPTLYHDIAILQVCTDSSHTKCGHIIPLLVMLTPLSNPDLFTLCMQFSFTPFQQTKLMTELNRRGFNQPPPWKTVPEIDVTAAMAAEYPPPKALQIERLTTPEGIVCETHGQAEYRTRKERRAEKEALKAVDPNYKPPVKQTAQPKDELTDMDAATRALWEEMSKPNNPD